jgi:hypothetical protein
MMTESLNYVILEVPEILKKEVTIVLQLMHQVLHH